MSGLTFLGTRGGPTPPKQRGAIGGDVVEQHSTAFAGSQGGPTPPKSGGDVWDSIAQVRDELAQPSFASHKLAQSPTSTAYAQQQQQAGDTYDLHLAHASKTRHHDQRSLDSKLNPALKGKRDKHQQSSGGTGQGGNGGGGGSGGGGCSSDQCDKGGGHCGTGCACCNNEQDVNACYQGSCGTNCTNCTQGGGGGGGGGKGGGGKGGGGKGGGGKGGRGKGGGGRGLGGGRLAGPGALGNLPGLGSVPLASSSATGSPSPVVVVLVIGAIALVAYFVWHKLRIDRTVDKQLDKGKATVADAAA